jgi:hypothetical protein
MKDHVRRRRARYISQHASSPSKLHYSLVVCSPVTGASGGESRRIEAVSSQYIKVRQKIDDNRTHLIQVDNHEGKQNNYELTRIRKCRAAHNLLHPPAMAGLRWSLTMPRYRLVCYWKGDKCQTQKWKGRDLDKYDRIHRWDHTLPAWKFKDDLNQQDWNQRW